jgi:hypothetical protein
MQKTSESMSGTLLGPAVDETLFFTSQLKLPDIK